MEEEVKAAEVKKQPEVKKFFEGTEMPPFKAGDRFKLKGVIFEVLRVTTTGIFAVPVGR